MLKKHYETVFGIFDHRANVIGNTRPLSGMASLPGNEIGGFRDIDYLLNKYEDLKIYDITKMSYFEYTSLSVERMEQLDNTCKRIKERRDRAAEYKERAEAEAVNNILSGKNKR